MRKGGFSWKRATGITRAKQSISRKTGIPLTKSGRQRKLGKATGCFILIFIILISLIFLLFFSLISCSKQTNITVTTETKTTNTTKSITTTSISDIEYGLTEPQRKKAFYDLVELQDLISTDDSERNEKLEEAYSTIAEKYNITKEEMKQIGIEGIEKNWPMPPLN